MSLKKLREPITFKKVKKKTNKKILKNLPVKRTINLIEVGKNPVNKKAVFAVFMIVLIFAAGFGKFAVIDRFQKITEIENNIKNLQSKIDEGYKTIECFGDIGYDYAHYTYSAMNSEELSRVDRIKIMELIDDKLLAKLKVSTWSLSGNVMQAVISDNTLQEINEVVHHLQAEEMVDYCSFTTATKDKDSSDKKESDTVIAQITVYFNVL